MSNIIPQIIGIQRALVDFFVAALLNDKNFHYSSEFHAFNKRLKLTLIKEVEVGGDHIVFVEIGCKRLHRSYWKLNLKKAVKPESYIPDMPYTYKGKGDFWDLAVMEQPRFLNEKEVARIFRYMQQRGLKVVINEKPSLSFMDKEYFAVN